MLAQKFLKSIIMKRFFIKKSIFLLLLLVLTHSLFATKYFVRPTGSSSNNGLSWVTAKANLGQVLSLAGNGDTIFVAVGTYTGTVMLTSSNSGVSIYGGFTGIETSLSERPAMDYGVTEYGQSSVIIGVNGGYGGSNAAVYMNQPFTNLVTFDGFSLQANAQGASSNAGTLICGSNTKIHNCSITGAYLHGISIYRDNTTITNCNIENCKINNNGYRTSSSTHGGGVYIYNATATLTDCIIDGNGSQTGGGVYCESSNATFIDCSIINNEGYYTGGIDNASVLKLTNCFVMNNNAWHGVNTGSCVGGIWTSGTTTIKNCIIANNTATNTHTSGYYTAGGVYFSGTSTAKEIVNSSIVNNLAITNYTTNVAGGIVCNNNTYLTDCLVWGNKKGTSFSQLYGTTGATNYSAIQGVSQTGIGNINLSVDNTGSQSGIFYPFFDTPTLFAGSGATAEENLQIMQANWRLTQGSACINTGIPNASGLGLPETDIYGAPRIFGGRIDVGAAEYAYMPQTIEWNQTLNFSIQEGSVPLTATATSGLLVTYTSSNPDVATINGNILILHSVGVATITASQEGNILYEPAPDVSKPLSVSNLMNQTIIWNQELEALMGDDPITLTATATSGLTVSYISDNTSIAIVTGNTLYIIGAGTATITAKQAGNANYNPAPDVSKLLTVSKQEQVIIWNQELEFLMEDEPVTLNAISTSGLPVTYISSNLSVAIINGNILTIMGTGTATITAKQVGNGTYNPASDVIKPLTVNKRDQAIIWNQELNVLETDPPIILTAYSTSGLSITYTSSNLAIATISGNILTIHGKGTAIITAKQGGNGAYNPAFDIEKVLFVDGVGIGEFETSAKIQIYPNPTTRELRVESEDLIINDVEIFDVFGRKLLFIEFQISSETMIDISHLPNGVYFLKIYTEVGQVIRKVLKE